MRRNAGETKRLLSNPAIHLPCADQGLTGATRTSRRMRSGASAAAIMATAPTVRGAEQIASIHIDGIEEPQQAFGTGPQATVQAARPVGKTDAQHIHRVNCGLASQIGQGVSPGERVAEQSMQQQQGGSGAAAQIAHARSLQGNPVIFNGARQRRDVLRGQGALHVDFPEFSG